MKKDITEEQREKFNTAKVGWGMRKVIETRKANGKRMEAPLIIPQTFISICGIRFDIFGENLENIVSAAIRLKLDIYHISDDYGAIKCQDAMYELINEK